MRLFVCITAFCLPFFLQAQQAPGQPLSAKEQQVFLTNLSNIMQHAAAGFAPLKTGEKYEVAYNTDGWESKLVLFPAQHTRKNSEDYSYFYFIQHHKDWKGVESDFFQEPLPVSVAAITKVLEPFLRSKKFEEVEPKGEYRGGNYSTRAFRSANQVIELVQFKSEGVPPAIIISKKAIYYEPDVAVIEGFLPKAAVAEVTIPFEEQKQMAANLAKILSDAPNQYRNLKTGENLLEGGRVKSEWYQAKFRLFPGEQFSKLEATVRYKDETGKDAVYTATSPYHFTKLAPLMASMLMGMGYDEVKPVDASNMKNMRAFRGLYGVVELVDPGNDYTKFYVRISQNARYYNPDVVLIEAGTNSASSMAVPVDIHNPVSTYPFFQKKYEKGTSIDGRLLGANFYVGNIYAYTNYFAMRPSKFSGVYKTINQYWNVEEVKGTVYWDYLGVSFTGEFMPYDIYNSKLWGRGYFKQGSDSTFGYLYHYTSEPYVWFVPADTNQSRIDLAYKANGDPYLRNVRAEAAADAQAWAEAYARLKRLPEGYFLSSYKGPKYDGNGNLIRTSSSSSAGGSSSRRNDECSTCNGKGWIEQHCEVCNNTRMFTNTVYDRVTVSGAYGRTNVTYNVGNGRTQHSWCAACMGSIITSSQYAKKMAELAPKKCTKCKGTGKPTIGFTGH